MTSPIKKRLWRTLGGSKAADAIRGALKVCLVFMSIATASACSQEPSLQPDLVNYDVGTTEQAVLAPPPSTDLLTALRETDTRAFIAVRDGRIILEWYATERDGYRRHNVASLAKGALGAASIALALDEGLLTLDDSVVRHVPEWADDPVKAEITLRHLATHSSGVPHSRAVPRSEWAEAFWSLDPSFLTLLLSDAPIASRVGSEFNYSGPGWGVLSLVLARAFERGGLGRLETVIRDRLTRPLEIPDDAWEMSYGRSFLFEEVSVYALWSGASFQPRALARFGELFLGLGTWGDQRLISSSSVREVTTYGGTALPSDEWSFHPAPAVGWWSNAEGAWPMLPSDAFAAAGLSGAVLLVVPSECLVMVRSGAADAEAQTQAGAWAAIYEEILVPFADALGIGTGSPTPC